MAQQPRQGYHPAGNAVTASCVCWKKANSKWAPTRKTNLSRLWYEVFGQMTQVLTMQQEGECKQQLHQRNNMKTTCNLNYTPTCKPKQTTCKPLRLVSLQYACHIIWELPSLHDVLFSLSTDTSSRSFNTPFSSYRLMHASYQEEHDIKPSKKKRSLARSPAMQANQWTISWHAKAVVMQRLIILSYPTSSPNQTVQLNSTTHKAILVKPKHSQQFIMRRSLFSPALM